MYKFNIDVERPRIDSKTRKQKEANFTTKQKELITEAVRLLILRSDDLIDRTNGLCECQLQ